MLTSHFSDSFEIRPQYRPAHFLLWKSIKFNVISGQWPDLNKQLNSYYNSKSAVSIQDYIIACGLLTIIFLWKRGK